MGVRRLKAYLEHHCPDACYQVNISDLVASHRQMTGNRAEIVVDAHTCYSMWCNGMDCKMGMEVQKLIERLRSFVASFENIGADLVFFIRGFMERRRSTWLSRKESVMGTLTNRFNSLKEGRPDSYSWVPMDSKNSDYSPPNMTNFVAFVLKHVLNCKVYVSVDECDEDIIQYVEENDSFAIFSRDTDFVVSNVNCIVLSVNDFNSSQMTTILYDRNVLCLKYLKIPTKCLPLLALVEFHNDQCNWRGDAYSFIPRKRLFNNMVQYTLAIAGSSVDEMIDTFCNDVFGDYSKKDELKLSYNSYFPKRTPAPGSRPPDDVWSQVIHLAETRLRNVLLPVTAWSVLTKRIFVGDPCFENTKFDHSGIVCDVHPRDQPSATITRSLRRRLYGILFHLIIESKSQPIVIEWCGEHEKSYQEPVSVVPEYIEAPHPGLLNLWDENLSEMLLQTKWILFLKVISASKPIRNVGAWMNLPANLVVATATCYYLKMEKEFLDESELHLVLATLAMYPAFNRSFLDAVYYGQCDWRAAKIGVTFDYTFNLVFCVLASCGYPVPLNQQTAYMKFEPKLLQCLYQRVKSDPDCSLLYGHGECIERFNQMYDTIHSWDVLT